MATDRSSESATFGPVQARTRDGSLAALSAIQQATSGAGSGLDVRSDNADAPTVRVRGAGDLLDLQDSSGASQFTVTNTGAVTVTGDQTVTGNYTITGDLTVNGGAVFNEASADEDFRVESNGNANMLFVDGGADRVGIGTALPSEVLDVVGGNVSITTAGNGLHVAEGVNAKMGVSAAMTAGQIVISTTAVTATSRIYLTPQTLGTIVRPAAVGVTARTAATSFTITSSDATDTSTVAWMIVEPA